jgi:hypothetical protein
VKCNRRDLVDDSSLVLILGTITGSTVVGQGLHMRTLRLMLSRTQRSLHQLDRGFLNRELKVKCEMLKYQRIMEIIQRSMKGFRQDKGLIQCHL